MKTGLVVGKFYPPHQGHHYLIQTAQSQVDHLIVLVVERQDQLIPGSMRAKWIQEVHPNVEVRVIEDICDDNNSQAWAAYTIRVLGFAPDVVFTSEDYGTAYAKFMKCQHVLVDPQRMTVPISATKVRSNPSAAWDYLSPGVKALAAKRVIVLGAESTGTTSMAKALAAHYQTAWVPEYGRIYYEGKMQAKEASKWSTEEFVFIATMQNQLEDALARRCHRLLIGDTDAFATALWHERYVGTWSNEVEAWSANRQPDLYLLTDIDIPFVQDGTRDGEHFRAHMHQRFIEELGKRQKPFLLLSGSHVERMKKATHAIDQLLQQPLPGFNQYGKELAPSPFSSV